MLPVLCRTCLVFLIMMATGFVWAAENRKTLQLAARLQPRASLSLSRAQVTFADHQNSPTISSRDGPVQLTVKVRGSAGSPATLMMRAESDLAGPEGRIPIQQVQWTAQGGGGGNGALSRTGEQVVGRWTTSGIHQTRLQFFLRNDGRLPPGEYRTYVNFSILSP